MIGREPRVQPPVLDLYSDMPLYNTKSVVHHTGVPAPTLRAWERRYGILSPRRSENDYRLYSERDMMTVTWLRERVESGMTISQAIALLRSLEPVRRRGRRVRSQSPSSPEVVAAPVPEVTITRFSLDDLVATLLDQFGNLDEYGVHRTTMQALAVYTVEEVCLRLFSPILVELGRRWTSGELGTSSIEHFASALIRAQLDGLFRSAATSGSGPLVLVGCAPGEFHELGALMVALFLRRAGVRVAYLGPNIEVDGLLATIGSLRPAGVLLSAALAPQAEALALIAERLKVTSSQPALYFGGRAYLDDPLIVERIPGHYLGSDACAAVDEIKKRLIT
jgi:MerR family transcriptional regulator, light-induced transcriptional regulator